MIKLVLALLFTKSAMAAMPNWLRNTLRETQVVRALDRVAHGVCEGPLTSEGVDDPILGSLVQATAFRHSGIFGSQSHASMRGRFYEYKFAKIMAKR
jgi:hypothetical protein